MLEDRFFLDELGPFSVFLFWFVDFLYFFLMIVIFTVVLDLQYSANFCRTAKWPSHTYIYVLFFTLPSIMFHHNQIDRVPCAIQQAASPFVFPQLFLASQVFPLNLDVPAPSPWPECYSSGRLGLQSQLCHSLVKWPGEVVLLLCPSVSSDLEWN